MSDFPLRPLPQVLVVQPDPNCPLERFEGWLHDAGVETRVIHPYADDVVPTSLEGYDALLVLGGGASAEEGRGPVWLSDVQVVLRHSVDLGLPVLGICLGGQLLAAATGGRVVRGTDGTEVGAVALTRRPEADDDPLFGVLPRDLLVGSMHGDAIVELPPGAVWLASTQAYPHQAFRLGAAAWGVQFHPEVSPERMGIWLTEIEHDDAERELLAEGVAEYAAHDEEARVGAEALARRFAAIVRAHREGEPPVVQFGPTRHL